MIKTHCICDRKRVFFKWEQMVVLLHVMYYVLFRRPCMWNLVLESLRLLATLVKSLSALYSHFEYKRINNVDID